jgi:sensor histidine kinase regulating citrate/malate metabolism
MRHDNKYHFDTIRELLHSGDIAATEKYLNEIKTHFSDKPIPFYCTNYVINALLASYSERCAKLNVKFSIRIAMPDKVYVPNYEMCIIIGNLLENAVHACEKIKNNRKIEFEIKTQGSHVAVMVKNNFNGIIAAHDGFPVSKKENGGLGLRSVQVVAARYNGKLMTEWDNEFFTAYVLLKK